MFYENLLQRIFQCKVWLRKLENAQFIQIKPNSVHSLWWIFLFGGFFSLVDFSLWWIKIQDGGSISQRVVRRFVQVAIQYTYSCIYVYRDNMYYTHKEQDKISRINFTERHFEICTSGLRYVEHLNTCILLHTCGHGSTIAFTKTFVSVFVFAFITL